MNAPKCTIIVSVYKDTDSLDLILDSLSKQNVLPNEVLVSQDCDSKEMVDFINLAREKYKNLDITHLFQEDDGWRKNLALNRAIIASKYEYLIFIDGDCVPYSSFIEGHIKNAKNNIVLCGKRIELGELFSNRLKKRELNLKELESKFFIYLPALIKDNARHVEDGIANKFLSKFFTYREVRHIVGCNFSCFKEDFLKINGFNEDFIQPSQGEDVDPSWRFKRVGIKLKNIRAAANIAHLWHEKRFDHNLLRSNKEIMIKTQQEDKYYTDNGIIKKWHTINKNS